MILVKKFSEPVYSTDKLQNWIYAPILKWIIQLMVNLSRKELINEPTGLERVLIYFPSTVLVGQAQVDVKTHFLLSGKKDTGCKVQSPYWSKDLQYGAFSILWFAVSPNHVKLTVDSKMAKEAHLAWGATGGRAHLEAAHTTQLHSTYYTVVQLLHCFNWSRSLFVTQQNSFLKLLHKFLLSFSVAFYLFAYPISILWLSFSWLFQLVLVIFTLQSDAAAI